MQEQNLLAPDTAQTSPSRAEQKRIEYDVHGPSVSPYFTLRIAVQAAPVPPLPSLQSQYKHKHKQKQQKVESSTVWEKSSSSSLRHRWRFIKQEELGLWRPAYDTTGPAVELGKEDQLLLLLLQHQHQQTQQPQPIGQKEEKENKRKEKEEKEESQRITTNGNLMRRAKSEGKVLSPRTRPVRGRRGWLEEVLQDDVRRNTGILKTQNTAIDNNNNNNNNKTTSLPYLRAEERSEQLPQSHAKKTNSLSTSTALPEGSTTQMGGKAENSKKTTTASGDRTTSIEKTTTTDAAQRLRGTLLTNSFQRMVDDVVQTHEYSGVERAQLLRHAGIFRELSLQSRYHEMHPLCNIRLVGSEFRTRRGRSVSAACSSTNNSYSDSNNCCHSSKQPHRYVQRDESHLLSLSESCSTGMRTEEALVAASVVSEEGTSKAPWMV
ncbi:hypothetical protein LSM04_000434 [Trypanosoma melophagium]|uniref:uncharacterized protein n=1 Tax=Trypanosoma melophagium TaxID=715481 RepID=UPI00351A4ED1|nr:hypothetical protein LSM04_000434 [Trypanosoma melophagium]